MRILVTGAAGFVGFHLISQLLEQGNTVVGVDDLSRGTLDNIKAALAIQRFELRIADVSTPEGASNASAGDSYDVVYLLAAGSDIAHNPKEPEAAFRRTFLTTYELLRHCASRVDRVVFASSSAVYGYVEEPIAEGHGPLLPISFYGAAKLASEAFLSAFASLYGLSVCCFRFPNVVGPRMTHGVVCDLLKKLKVDPTRLEVLGDGNQRKPYLHVSDLVRALVWPIPLRRGTVEHLNVAGDGTTTVREIVQMVLTETGYRDVRVEYTGGSGGWLGDVPSYTYDTTKIRRLGWGPTLTSHDAVTRAIREELEAWK